jgi:hypothetical protein
VPSAAKTGTLGVEADAVCEIELDGVATGKHTPDTFTLAAGVHRVRLVNRELELEDTFEVEIEANRVLPVQIQFYATEQPVE